ncbi:PREDICTED: uncharacterized protein LOC106821315 [Priapulus caudatus]|uniref:Uncharacterized protein LOC106821315 n=1 Tax=Priapulus caudatus TaxID=37621 RepID=A0ABM1FAT2_PRICU|nr:PREDICTED: uncharacterized protein LOC106821315 [Priapulus caudatus]
MKTAILILLLGLLLNGITSQTSLPEGTFELVFPTKSNDSYATSNSSLPRLNTFTVCLRARTISSGANLTVLSYVGEPAEGALFAVYIAPEGVGFDIGDSNAEVLAQQVRDGESHDICVLWSATDGIWVIYVDAVLVGNGSGIAVDEDIVGGATVVVGQRAGDGESAFRPDEGFQGYLRDVNVFVGWLTAARVQEVHDACASEGDALAWDDLRSAALQGDVSLADVICEAAVTRPPVNAYPYYYGGRTEATTTNATTEIPTYRRYGYHRDDKTTTTSRPRYRHRTTTTERPSYRRYSYRHRTTTTERPSYRRYGYPHRTTTTERPSYRRYSYRHRTTTTERPSYRRYGYRHRTTTTERPSYRRYGYHHSHRTTTDRPSYRRYGYHRSSRTTTKRPSYRRYGYSSKSSAKRSGYRG